jgi:DinB superfamily
VIEPIRIPDATLEPAAYVRALVATLGDREPLAVLRQTPTAVRSMCAGLTEVQWRTPMADGEWTALQVVGHLLDVEVVYGFRWRLILTQDRPAYPGYDEKRWSLLPRPAPTQLLAAMEGLRAVNLAVLEGVDDGGRRRLGVHGEQGEERFDLTVRKVAGHDLAHLNQLARTVAVATMSPNE